MILKDTEMTTQVCMLRIPLSIEQNRMDKATIEKNRVEYIGLEQKIEMIEIDTYM